MKYTRLKAILTGILSVFLFLSVLPCSNKNIVYADNDAAVTLTFNINWNDYSNALQLRPANITFKVFRAPTADVGQQQEPFVGLTSGTDYIVNINAPQNNVDQWICTISSPMANPNSLKQIATNNLPYIYEVRAYLDDNDKTDLGNGNGYEPDLRPYYGSTLSQDPIISISTSELALGDHKYTMQNVEISLNGSQTASVTWNGYPSTTDPDRTVYLQLQYRLSDAEQWKSISQLNSVFENYSYQELSYTAAAGTGTLPQSFALLPIQDSKGKVYQYRTVELSAYDPTDQNPNVTDYYDPDAAQPITSANGNFTITYQTDPGTGQQIITNLKPSSNEGVQSPAPAEPSADSSETIEQTMESFSIPFTACK
ncbi:MAG: hypothetical protein LKF79_02490 [Solobacterium sp.]|jgi:hypothetical protein|nr:hypothetical protein [Solobacterium sp.]MCH4221888.1 hypothetical protein [Solobacterium sp.]MCH4265496.1 hypothetical protein [Solobacterium sp.]